MTLVLKQIGMILLVSGVLAGVANSVLPQRISWLPDGSWKVEAKALKHGIPVISLAGALELLQETDALFIDARAANLFAEGHISGARSIPFLTFEDHFETLMEFIDSGQQLVLYCSHRDCDDSLLLALELQAFGGENLVIYIDGFDLWEKQGGAVEVDR